MAAKAALTWLMKTDGCLVTVVVQLATATRQHQQLNLSRAILYCMYNSCSPPAHRHHNQQELALKFLNNN
jgi:hypothetical protein